MGILNAHPTSPMNVTIRLQSSETPPSGNFPQLAGAVPLSYLLQDTNGSWNWMEFPVGGVSKTLAPRETWTLRLGLRRADLAAYQPQGTNTAAYQGILEVTDSGQSLLIPVPVTASSPELVGASGPTTLGTLSPFNTMAGLWVGEAQLNQVNAPAYTGDGLLRAPPLSLRLLVHVDAYGNTRLLQQVALAWDNTITDPPYTNGTYALYADARDVPSTATGVKRISSAAFPMMAPVSLSGLLGSTNETMVGLVNIGFDDPTNPFLHRYHPQHDNRDWDFVAYTNAVEVPNITRKVSLSFTTVTNATTDPVWGVDTVAGTYSETLYGLRAQSITTSGPFALKRISRIDQLQGITP